VLAILLLDEAVEDANKAVACNDLCVRKRERERERERERV